jgi:hypothetical protein
MQHLQSLSTIKSKLIAKFDPAPLGPWSLDHELFRSVEANDQTPPRFQHILRLRHRPGKAFVAVSQSKVNKGEANTKDHVITIPSPQVEAFTTLLKDRFAALWTPRASLRVNGGLAYDTGEFVVRLGELRQTGGQQPLRAVLCSIETKTISVFDDGGANQDHDIAKAVLSDAWKSIGVDGAKEFFGAHATEQAAEDGFDEARLWCEVLRLRA